MRGDYGYFEEDHLGKPYDLKLLRRLFPHVRKYGFLFVLSIGLVTVITALDLSVPYLTKVAIDRYIVQDIVDDEPGSSQQRRFYRADLRVPRVKEVVNRYPSFFEVKWPYARILYEDLAELDKSDLGVVRKQDYTGVTRIALIFLVVIICHFFLSFGNVLVMEYAGQSVMHDLRLLLFSHIQGLSMEFFTRNPVGRLVTRVTNDVQNMHEFFTSVITVVFKDMFLLLGITVVLLVMNWKLALVSLLMLPCAFLAAAYFRRLARDVFREVRVKVSEINTRLQESIDGIRIIQLFFQEGENYERFRKLNHENYIVGMRQVNVFAVFMPVIEVLSSVTTALVVWYGGRHVLGETLSLGVLVAFISYMKMFFRPIRDIAEKYNIMQSAMASSERIFLLLDSRDRIPDPDIPRPMGQVTAAAISVRKSWHTTSGDQHLARDVKQLPLEGVDTISFERVWFSYEEGSWILKDLSLTVRRGETLAIVGPTGAGKSTLMHLIERFYDPTKGSIAINGTDMRQISKASLRARMALITQDVFLFADTVKANITAGNPQLSDEHLQEIISSCRLDRLIAGLPQGINTVLTEGARTLSSGERQLVAFARALARDPEILLLDEATSSVDTQTEQLIQEATLGLMEERTAVVVAHRLSTIHHADRIVVLYRGRIQEVGSHEELMSRQGLYYQLYHWQAVS